MRSLILFGASLLALLVAALPAAAAERPALVRIVHAAPDTPPVDVRIDERVVLTSAQFPTISDYLEVPAGAHTLTLTPSAGGTAVLTSQASFEAGAVYTVAAIGLANVTAEVYRDDLAAPAAGKARVRIIHTSPDAPGADVEVVEGPTLVQNLAFTEASPYLDVAEGSYNLRLVIGTDNTVVVPLPNTSFKAGTIYDVIATGRLATIQVIVGTYTPSTAGEPRALMPSAGASDSADTLLLLALALLLGGLLLHWPTLRLTAARGWSRRDR